MESSDAVVGFDRSAALGAFGITITFDPMMGHDLRRFLRLDVRADARGRRPLDASFVHRILAKDAAKAFLAQADEHVEAEIAIGWTVKMFEPPQMITILFNVRIESEEDEEGDGGHASTFPFFQRDSTIVVVIYFGHHLLQDRFQFGSVPSEVFRYGHHLIHDTIHFVSIQYTIAVRVV